MLTTGEKYNVVQYVVADPWDNRPITSIDPTQELTGPEIVYLEIFPVLFIHLLTTYNSLPQPCSTD